MSKKNKKILFIEDESDQIMMISLRLQKNGYEVISSMEGAEGIRKAVAEKPDLILVDVIMPGVDGFEVCRRLRKNPVTKDIPIISTTAAGADDVEHQCLTAGADDCVRKPYDSQDLLMKIKRLLEK
ncbi:MAG: response regulator [Candidatus Omnitrophota bacterium]